MRTRHGHSIFCFAVLLAALMCGCSTLDVPETLPWKEEPEQLRAARILAIWSDTVLNSPGQPPLRGFGGRLFFYSDAEPDPIQVDGSVTVYAFDGQKSDHANVAPEKKFVFPASNMSRHYSKCVLGHSYSFWLPWDEVGGPTRQISLIVRFEGTDGTVVLSEATRKLLPGIAAQTPLPRTTVASSQDTVRQISYAAPASKPTVAESIPLNPSMSARLRRAGDSSYTSQHDAAQEKHFQRIQEMQEASRDQRQPRGASTQHSATLGPPRADTTTPIVLNSPAGQAGLPAVTAPLVGSAVPQSAIGYQPTRSQVPFARTAQQIGVEGQNRQSLGLSRSGRPPVQRPGNPAGY